MHSFPSALALAGLAALAVASPLEERGHSFTLSQKATGKSKLRNGAISVLQTFNKFGVEAPENVKSAAAAATQQGSVTTTPEQYDSEYLTPVSVGGTTLMLDFDTGSADLWVFSNELPASERSGHSYYTVNPAKKLAGETWSIGYQDGSGASGDVYADQVVIGPVTATRQAVEAATSVSTQFVQDVDNDGLVGLAFSSINTVSPDQQLTFFDTVKNTLTQKLFAADLKYHAAGTYDFGTTVSSKYTGTIDYSPVDSSQGFWEFTASGYAVAGARTTKSLPGIADTGTTLLFLPSAVVSAYYSRVSGATNSRAAGGWIFPCSASLPTFSLVVDGNLHTVPGQYINYAPYTSTKCFGGIQVNTGLPFSIFGDIFLKSQYVVFDETQSTPRIGLANQS